MKTLQDKLKALPADRRNKIAARTGELIREEMTMRELRKARNITQVKLAKELNVKQEQISRIEKRSDPPDLDTVPPGRSARWRTHDPG
jgi:DNA-binding XRE family transcriptional regulator